MKSEAKCKFCGSKTKDMSHCDKCGKLVCCDCVKERADIGCSWVCPACDKKYKYKGQR